MFWHQISLLMVLGTFVSTSLMATLMSKPPTITSREIEQNGNVVSYIVESPGLAISPERRIAKKNDGEIDTLDQEVIRDAYVTYYIDSDENISTECLIATVVILTTTYFLKLVESLLRSRKSFSREQTGTLKI